jgi:hypothetical protein
MRKGDRVKSLAVPTAGVVVDVGPDGRCLVEFQSARVKSLQEALDLDEAFGLDEAVVERAWFDAEELERVE